MRRRLRRLATLAMMLAVAVPALLLVTGVTEEARDRALDLLLADPSVSDDLAVVGVTDPRSWAAPVAPDGVDSDRRRFGALVRTLEDVVASEPLLVVMTDVVTNEDLTEQDARSFVEVLATGRVLMPYLDDAPVTGPDQDVQRRFRRPLSVTDHLPDAHAVVEDTGPGDRVRTLSVLEPWRADGEEHRFVALPLAALGAVAAVPLEPVDGAIRAGATTIPLEDGRLRVNFTSRLVDGVPGTLGGRGGRLLLEPDALDGDTPFVAAEAVVAGTAAPTQLADRIVLVGTIDPGQARYVPVPGSTATGVPELWVHANALNTLLVGATLAPAAPLEHAAWLIVVTVAAGLTALGRPLREAPLWLATLLGLVLVVTTARGGAGQLLDPVVLGLGVVLGWSGTVLARYVVEGRQRQRVAALFRRYVPDVVAEQLIEEEVSVADLAAGTRAEVTVVFCDLRGFTAQAGALPPGRVRDLLNVYYRHTTGVVLDHGGTVLQYVGDEVFAVFGVPLAQPDHVARAVATALGMQAVAPAIAEELAQLGVDPVRYGIGVHTGSVVAAHVGDAARTQYAVVGDTVNVGARLCSQADADEVVISEDVLQALPTPPPTEALGSVPLKGVARDLPIHRVRLSAQGKVRQVPEG